MAILDVIEWRDETGRTIVQRIPPYGPGTVKLGAQLTVRESQAAVFFRDGKAYDVFQAGRHTLTTLNLPLLNVIINLPFGGTTPFQAEVYFVNLKTFTDLKWGTPAPVVFRDKELAMVRLRAFGEFTMHVTDPQLFVNKIVGTEHAYDQESVESFMRDFIVARFNDTLGEVVDTVLDLPKQYDELAAAVKGRVRDDFAAYGIELVDLIIAAVTPPEEVMQMIDERGRMEAVDDMGRFTRFQTAQAVREMAQGVGEGGEGGSMAGAGMGLGAGLGMGAMIPGMLRDALTAPPPGATITCPKCNAQAPANAAFCPSCGQALVATCAKCHAPLPAGAQFCPACGAAVAAVAKCAKCGADVPAGAQFCPKCGQQQ